MKALLFLISFVVVGASSSFSGCKSRCLPKGVVPETPPCCNNEDEEKQVDSRYVVVQGKSDFEWTTALRCPCDPRLVQVDTAKWNPEEKVETAKNTSTPESDLAITDNLQMDAIFFGQGRTNNSQDRNKSGSLRPIKVAILDSGVSDDILRDHSDEIAEVLNTYEIGDDVSDEFGHGSTVFAVIDGHAKSKAQYYIYKCIGEDGYASTFSLACALRCAQNNQVDIINISLGSYNYSAVIDSIINRPVPYQAIISSRGNDCKTDENYSHYPSRLAKVWGIMGLDADWKERSEDVAQLWGCTNGSEQKTNFAAPSSISGSTGSSLSNGSSFAAAFVTGRFVNYLSRPEYSSMHPHAVFRDYFLNDVTKTIRTQKYLHAARTCVDVTIITDRPEE